MKFAGLMVCAFVVLLCTVASATVTYSYVGNPFDQWGQGYQCPPVCNVDGTFTLAQPLAPNLPEFTLITPISMTLESRGVSLTLANVAQYHITLSTDSSEISATSLCSCMATLERHGSLLKTRL